MNIFSTKKTKGKVGIAFLRKSPFLKATAYLAYIGDASHLIQTYLKRRVNISK